MATIQFKINSKSVTLKGDKERMLLWMLRTDLALTGVKYGCGIAQCGACTVLLNGTATRTCILPVGFVGDSQITTIQGLGTPETPHPVQAAWIEHQVAQCGYCQSGQIMQAASFLATTPNPTNEQIDAAMNGNLCRCGTYPRIRAAVKTAAAKLKAQGTGATNESATHQIASVTTAKES